MGATGAITGTGGSGGTVAGGVTGTGGGGGGGVCAHAPLDINTHETTNGTTRFISGPSQGLIKLC